MRSWTSDPACLHRRESTKARRTSQGRSMVSDPRPLPLYVQRKVSKGRVYFYFRWHDVYRRLPDDPSSEEFKREYARAFASISPEIEQPIISGSVRALLKEFKETP